MTRREAAQGLCEDRAGHSSTPRVRFRIDVQPDESLPGIVVRAARDHVMPKVSRVLAAADITIYNPGAIISLDPDRLPLLAHVLRQQVSTLEERLATTEGKTHRFGNLAFQTGILETRLRRIAPVALETGPHHRFAWMNRLLPCCPETGEHLVSHCGACASPLRWYVARGIDTCESCRQRVAPSELPPLTGEQLGDYRVVSDLMSIDQSTRDQAMSRLPGPVRRFLPGTLAQTALQVVSLLNGEAGLGGDVYHILSRDPVAQSELVCRAGRVLMTWPDGLVSEFRRKVERLGRDHRQFFLTWRSLKRFATPKLVGDERAAIVIDGLPDLQESIWRSFASDGSVYSTQDAMRVLGIDSGRTRRLVAIPALVHMEKPSRYRGNRQFRAHAIDELRRRKDASTTFAAVTEATGIPHYGVEQLAATNQLEFRDGCAMAVAYPRPFVSTTSYVQLKESIEEARRRSKAPKDTRRLRECSRLLGGGEKPWNLILEALIAGDLAFWGDTERFDIRHIVVRPEEMMQFLGTRFDASDYDFPFSDTYAKREAAEVLTIDTPLLDANLKELNLHFRKLGRAREIGKAAILDAARTIVSNAELGEHWGIAPKKVRYDGRVDGIARLGFGWSRAEAIAAGLIPSLA